MNQSLNPDLLRSRIAAAGASLSPTGRRVATYLDRNRLRAITGSAVDLAAAVGTSDATVIRTIQALGFSGLPELRDILAASLEPSSASPADALRRTLTETRANAEQAVQHVLDAQRDAVDLLRSEPGRQTLTAGIQALVPTRRILVYGIGPTAAMAQYTAALLGRSGQQARAITATGIALADQLLDLEPGDGLLALAYGRAYREVTVVFAEAARLGLPIVLVSDSLEPRLARQAAVVVAAPRGRAGRVALHGATLVALEALVLGIAAMKRTEALSSLDRLATLRRALTLGDT